MDEPRDATVPVLRKTAHQYRTGSGDELYVGDVHVLRDVLENVALHTRRRLYIVADRGYRSYLQPTGPNTYKACLEAVRRTLRERPECMYPGLHGTPHPDNAFWSCNGHSGTHVHHRCGCCPDDDRTEDSYYVAATGPGGTTCSHTHRDATGADGCLKQLSRRTRHPADGSAMPTEVMTVRAWRAERW